MAEANFTTLQKMPVQGVPMVLPVGCEHEVSIILRTILAMDEFYDTGVLIAEGEPYEALVRRLQGYHQNIGEIAARIREVVDYE